MTVWVLLIETVQFVTFSGSADIDDLILNDVEAMFGYAIVQIGFIKNILKLSA